MSGLRKVYLLTTEGRSTLDALKGAALIKDEAVVIGTTEQIGSLVESALRTGGVERIEVRPLGREDTAIIDADRDRDR